MFFMTGIFRVFQLGVVEHACRFFVEPYAETLLPIWSLWVTGTAIPFIELVGGALILIGWRRREALLGLGTVLIIVTFGHLLVEPFFRLNTHVIPRLILILFLLMIPGRDDRFSLDELLASRRSDGGE